MFDITKSTMAEQIARSIAEAIMHGHLKPGQRLNEIELGARFGTSRAPIREAAYILEREGVVVRHPRRGVFVKDYTVKELRDLYDAVYRLESIALARVLDRASASQLAAMHLIVDRMAESVKRREIPAYMERIEELFHEVFRISDNGVLQDFYAQLRSRLKPFRFMSLSHSDSLKLSLEEYRDMLAGLEQRDAKQVEEALERKERRAVTRLLEAARDRTQSAA